MKNILSERLFQIFDTLDPLHSQLISIFNKSVTDKITAEQFFILRKIHEQGRCNSSELSHITSVNRSAITVMVNRLVNKGYIVRSKDQNDRRIIWLEITDPAIQLIHSANDTINSHLNLHLYELQEKDFEEFSSIISRISYLLEKKK